MVFTFNRASRMLHATPLTTDVTTFFRHAAALGPLRAVLRGCTGLAEITCSADDLLVTGGSLRLGGSGARLHVPLAALRSVRLVPAGTPRCTRHDALWFHGRSGAPCLLLALDQTDGDARLRQDAVFHALRVRWGTRLVLVPEPVPPRVLH
jgi:hypothetical protein